MCYRPFEAEAESGSGSAGHSTLLRSCCTEQIRWHPHIDDLVERKKESQIALDGDIWGNSH